MVEPRLPSIPMSLNADALHFSNTRGGVVSVQNSRFEAQGDDGINMPTRYQDISVFNTDRTAFMPGKLGFVPDLLHGDTLQFFSRHNLASLGFAVVDYVGAQYVQLVSEIPAAVGIFDLFTNAHAHADSTIIANCTFKNNRARFGDSALDCCLVDGVLFMLLLLISSPLQGHCLQGSTNRRRRQHFRRMHWFAIHICSPLRPLPLRTHATRYYFSLELQARL